MPKIAGILETCLYARDLTATRAFYETVLGLAPIFEEPRMVVYDVAPSSVLIIFAEGATREAVDTPGGTIPSHDGSGPQHVAFQIASSDLEAWASSIETHGVAIESKVDWPRGGTSLYMRDPDNHLVELATPGLWPNESAA